MKLNRAARRQAFVWGGIAFVVHSLLVVVLVIIRFFTEGVGYVAATALRIQRVIDFMVAVPLEANYQRLPAWLLAPLGYRPESLYFSDLIVYGVAGGFVYFLAAAVVVLFRQQHRGRSRPEAELIRS